VFDFLDGFGPQLLLGALLTIQVAIAALAMGTVMGIAGALCKLSKFRVLRWLGWIYSTVIRGIPDLLVLFIIFFGGTVTLSAIFGRYAEISAFWSGAFALAFVFGAYATEIFRGSILAVPKGQSEASHALGIHPLQNFLLIVLPQAWRIALPAYGNQLLVLMKQTSLISIVGLEELMRKGKLAVGATDEPFTFYATVAVIYLCITTTITVVLRRAENCVNRGYAR